MSQNAAVTALRLNRFELQRVQELFTSLTGNKLGDEKRSLIESRLRKRLAETKTTPTEYLELLEHDPEERERFISVLTTHKTDWFREPLHFEFMKQLIRTEWADRASPIQIWSAASSTGEEIYSTSIILQESGVTNYRILGTDISQHCLETAETGIYPKHMVDQQVPPALKAKYFLRNASKEDSSRYKVVPNIQKNIKWRQYNLLESNLNAMVQFDLIFLRNVLIYFNPENSQRAVSRLERYMKPGAYLIIGLSETITDPAACGLERVENSIYRRK